MCRIVTVSVCILNMGSDSIRLDPNMGSERFMGRILIWAVSHLNWILIWAVIRLDPNMGSERFLIWAVSRLDPSPNIPIK
jgi:hypothetical protein